ncbi:hypothetical protein ACROYT_G014762 [Oculina patagonica]
MSHADLTTLFKSVGDVPKGRTLQEERVTMKVRKRRIDVLDERGLNKRPRNSSSSQGDESGIVVLNPQTSSLPCHTS